MSPSETLNRLRKAAKLADVLGSRGATPDSLRTLPDEGWAMAAEIAGVEPPGMETRYTVGALLERGGLGAHLRSDATIAGLVSELREVAEAPSKQPAWRVRGVTEAAADVLEFIALTSSGAGGLSTS